MIPAIRGKRLNVIAALMSSGELEDKTFFCSMSSKIFTDFVDSTAVKYDKEIVFILDNASFHKSKEVQEWEEKKKTKKCHIEILATIFTGAK